MIILLVALTGGCYLREMQPCLLFTPTGDALYDRYAKAVIDRHGPRLFSYWSEHDTNPTTLPDDVLAEWEADFGDDPRYWQLRYWCTKYRHRNPLKKKYILDDQLAAIKHLEHCRDTGVIDSDTAVLLFKAGRSTWGRAIADEWGLLKEAEIDSEYFGYLDLETEDEIRIAVEMESRLMETLDLAVELDPGNCWAYWERALYILRLGEDEQGLSDLRQGNACPITPMPVVFPVSKVVDDLEQGNIAGNRILAGTILHQGIVTKEYLSSDLYHWKEVTKENCIRMGLGGETEISNALHQALCRLGQAPRGHRYSNEIFAVCINIQINYVLDECSGGLTTEQIDFLTDLDRTYYRVQRAESIERAECRYRHAPLARSIVEQLTSRERNPHLTCFYDFDLYWACPSDPPLDNFGEVLEFSSLLWPWRYHAAFFDFWEEQDRFADQFGCVFQDMAELDFATLERPLAWGPLPIHVPGDDF